MKVKLYSDTKFSNFSTKVQVCLNRGVPPQEVFTYLNNSYSHINPPEAFGEKLLIEAAKLLISTISANKSIHIIVDSDVDGYTSAALLVNYLYKLFPSWVEGSLSWSLHKDKSHGLSEFMDTLMDKHYDLVVCPDSATNDHKEIEKLHSIGTKVLILDHHLSECGFSPYAVTINSQYNYPNEFLCGGGVVWQFCRYIDKLLGKSEADNFLDLVALSLQSDMMDIRSLETKELIFLGLKEENIRNPLVYSICQKNEYSMTKADYEPSKYNNLKVVPMSISFFCTPLLNAVCRSGTIEEKELVFKALLEKEAFKKIPSTKRGHKLGEMETVVNQVTRQLTNIKNRQERNVVAGMEKLEAAAAEMLHHKVLVFTLEPDEIQGTIRGLCANKLMAKYQRPVCVTTRLQDGSYAGSMRGYSGSGIESFKDIAEQSEYCTGVIGHHNAAGIFLSDPGAFVDDMDEKLKNLSTEIVHWVDYIYDADNINGQAIMDMAELNDYLGQGFARPMVYIENCLIENYMIMKEKHLKINLSNNCSAIIWNVDEDLLNSLDSGEKILINFVAKCNINTWGFERTPQLVVEDYEIIKKKKYIF